MYLTHDDLDNYWVVDIETDDLKAARIWCIVMQCVGTKEVITFHGDLLYGDFKAWHEAHPKALLIGHNLLSLSLIHI